jgi:hypothetical protein
LRGRLFLTQDSPNPVRLGVSFRVELPNPSQRRGLVGTRSKELERQGKREQDSQQSPRDAESKADGTWWLLFPEHVGGVLVEPVSVW